MSWFRKNKEDSSKLENKKSSVGKYRSADVSSGLVRVSHLIKSNTTKNQVVKIGDKYFKVRELG